MFDESTEGLFDNVDLEEFESNGQPTATGASPDGLGATPEEMADPDIGPTTDFDLPSGGSAFEPGYNGDFKYGASAGIEYISSPLDTSPAAATRSAGFTLLFVAISTGIGYAAKGGLGAATGLLASGALANGYRAQRWWSSPDPQKKHEAIVSGIFSAGGIAAAGYVGYKSIQRK